MKFTMKMPFDVVPGARKDGYYTATVLDKDGRTIGYTSEYEGRSTVSQDAANEQAVRKAREWAQRIRGYAGL